jgi:hypothetical protein
MSSKDGNETSAAVDATVLIIGAGELVPIVQTAPAPLFLDRDC